MIKYTSKQHPLGHYDSMQFYMQNIPSDNNNILEIMQNPHRANDEGMSAHRDDGRGGTFLAGHISLSEGLMTPFLDDKYQQCIRMYCI